MAIGLGLWWGVGTDSHHPARGQQGPGLAPLEMSPSQRVAETGHGRELPWDIRKAGVSWSSHWLNVQGKPQGRGLLPALWGGL